MSLKDKIYDILCDNLTDDGIDTGSATTQILALFNVSEWVAVIDQHPDRCGNFDVTIETKNSRIKSEAYYDGVSFKKEDVTHWKQQDKPPLN